MKKGERMYSLLPDRTLYYRGSKNESQRVVGFMIDKNVTPHIIKYGNELHIIASVTIQMSENN